MSHSYHHVAIAGVSGSFSSLGYLIAQEFLNRKYKVSILVRADAVQNADKKKKLDTLSGVNTIVADFTNKDKLAEQLKGVDLLISALGGEALYQAQLNLIEAAKVAGVRRFVPSEFGIDSSRVTTNGADNNGFPFFAPKFAVAKATKESGLEYTFIKTGFFPDTTFTNAWFGFEIKEANKVSIVGDGNTLISWTLIPDVAKAIPDILENPESKNAEINISSFTATLNDVLNEIEKVTGRKIAKTFVSPESERNKIKADATGWNTVKEQLLLVLETGQALFIKSHNAKFPFHSTPIQDWIKKTF